MGGAGGRRACCCNAAVPLLNSPQLCLGTGIRALYSLCSALALNATFGCQAAVSCFCYSILLTPCPVCQALGWATSLVAGESSLSISSVSFFYVKVELTKEGQAHAQEVRMGGRDKANRRVGQAA